jgi:hypothetical protein
MLNDYGFIRVIEAEDKRYDQNGHNNHCRFLPDRDNVE